jgi:hypothetical protein
MTVADDACAIAINLARNGYAVFPCRLVIGADGKADKPPTRPKRDGGNGFHDATCDPDEIAWLWKCWPGELIGVRTGPASGIDVLDADKKHPEARAWWRVNHERLPETRTYATYSHGLHLYFQHRDGVPSVNGKLCRGIDTKADGGYVIHWFSYGRECRDHSPPVPFPDWLYVELTYQPPAPAWQSRPSSNPDRAIDGPLAFLARAREGNRNGSLFWAACRLAENGLGHDAQLAALLPIATGIGLTESEARRTIKSAQGRESRRAAA